VTDAFSPSPSNRTLNNVSFSPGGSQLASGTTVGAIVVDSGLLTIWKITRPSKSIQAIRIGAEHATPVISDFDKWTSGNKQIDDCSTLILKALEFYNPNDLEKAIKYRGDQFFGCR